MNKFLLRLDHCCEYHGRRSGRSAWHNPLSGESVFKGLGHELRDGVDAAIILTTVHLHTRVCLRATWHATVYRAVEEEPNIEHVLRHFQINGIYICASCSADITYQNLTGIMRAKVAESIVSPLLFIHSSVY